jgi:hypothetical protein
MSNFIQITPEELAAKEKEAFDKGKAEGKTEAETTAKTQLAEAGVTAAAKERERIKSVLDVPHVGHEELFGKLAFDGRTTAAEAALAMVNAERATREKVQGDIRKDAPKPLDNGGDPGAGGGTESAGFDEERCKKNWAANTGNVRGHYGSESAYIAFERQMAAGNIRILEKGAK